MYKVLVVEDEKIIRQGITVLIKDLTKGFIVVGEAADGEQALELLQHSPPDVLITDIRMPKMDGLTLIERVRDLYPELSIVIISGYDDFEYAKKAIRYGVRNYLLKPINRTEFVKTMETIESELNKVYMNQVSSTIEKENPDISKISMYIMKNMDQEITLETVANLVNLHPTYFSQWFKKETGTNFSDYVKALKIRRAKQLLLETKLKIYEVAMLTGYQSEKHFMKVFKQETNQTPSEYRRHGR